MQKQKAQQDKSCCRKNAHCSLTHAATETNGSMSEVDSSDMEGLDESEDEDNDEWELTSYDFFAF